MSHKLRTWGPALAVTSTLLVVSSCAKKEQTSAPASTAAEQPSTQPAPPPGASADKMASSPAEPVAIPPAPSEPPPPPPKPAVFVIPAGTSLSMRTISGLSTKTNKSGEPFTGTLGAPLVVGGVTIARPGSNVTGSIVASDPGGRVKGVASMTLGITSITTVDNQTLRVSASPFTVDAKSTKKKDAAKIGGAAAVGTVIGAIAGGKGAAIGALAGGGAGTGVVLATRGDPAVLPSESIINVRLAGSLTVTERQPGTIANKKKAAAAAPVDQDAPPANQ